MAMLTDRERMGHEGGKGKGRGGHWTNAVRQQFAFAPNSRHQTRDRLFLIVSRCVRLVHI